MNLPQNLVDSCNGFAVDIGGSVIKIVYKSRSPLVSGLQLVSFDRQQLDDAVFFLKENCLIQRSDGTDPPVMYATGLGGFQFGSKFEKELKVRMNIVTEYDCFINVINYLLKTTNIEDQCVHITKEVSVASKTETDLMVKFYDDLREKGLLKQRRKPNLEQILTETPSTIAQDRYPYILSINGSGFACLQVQEDGSFDSVNITPFGGKSFLGLGSLLTGAKSYDELMSLAERGSHLPLDLTSADITIKSDDNLEPEPESNPPDDDDNVYAAFAKLPPRPVFLWGKAVNKNLSDYSREDVAATLLHSVCDNLVTTVLNAMHLTKTTHAFMVGSFMSRKSVQDMIIEKFEKRKWLDAISSAGIDSANHHIHILHNGGHLGALGAMFLSHQ